MVRGNAESDAAFTISATVAECESAPLLPCAARWKSPVGAFDAALLGDPTITSWNVSNALTTFYLSGSDAAAIGGDLAYDYGHRNALTGIGATPAQSTLGGATFASGAQALQAPATLYSGTVRLQ